VEQREIDVKDTAKQVEVMQQEVRRKEQEQTAEQIVPARAMADAVAATADGEKRKNIIVSEGERQKLILIAEGEQQRLSKVALGQAEKIRQEGTAEADIIKLKGEAEAAAILAKGLAEAEAMMKKAEAWERYGRAAVTEIIIDRLPDIVAEAAKPLQNTEKLIIMGSHGPSELVGSVVNVAAQAPALVKALTGMDVSDLATKVKEMMGK
jgi:flotillin